MATLGFIRQTKGKLVIVLVDVKQKLILYLWEKKYKKYVRDVKVIKWELQHRLVVVDLDKKIVRKQRIIRRKVWKSNENRTKKKSKRTSKHRAPDLWKTFKDDVLKACNEVCGKKSRRDRGDM